jgi:hypothetical protein
MATISKAVILYLAPLLSLTAILLSTFAFLAPTMLLHDRVALLTVMPAPSNQSSQVVDGPSIFLGALGSCSRLHHAGPTNCTSSSFSPVYDLSILRSDSFNRVLAAPTAGSPVFIAMALSLSILFSVIYTFITFRHKMGDKVSAALDKPTVQHFTAWTGFFGFFVGLTSFLVLRMWFGKAVDDFNADIAAQGNDASQLVAATGNAFTMIWVAYSFYAVPVIISLAKLNVTMSK